MIHSNTQAFCHRLTRRANAWAALRGSEEYPGLLGSVKFFQTPAGVLVLAEVWGLPTGGENAAGLFGFAIHPGHVDDLPPLAARHSYVWTAFLTARFNLREVLGRTVILRAGAEDLGKVIARGEIK